jgi:Holliday junction resolvasome RuvABC endonuclease subunit
MIKLQTVEKYMQRRLKRNHTSLGFDVALRKTGIVLLRTTETNLIIDDVAILQIPRDAKEDKAQDIFTSQLDAYRNRIIQKHSLDSVVIENCFYGLSVTVLKGLARCSGLARDRFKPISKECYYKYPKEVRSLIGVYTGKAKGTALKKIIVDYINAALDLKLLYKEHDTADAYACALVGLLTNKGA